MIFARRSLAALAAAFLSLGATPASAAPIDNPGTTTFAWPSGASPLLAFNSTYKLHQAGSSLDLDVFSDGSFLFVGATTAYETVSPAVTVAAQTLKAQLQIIDVLGALDAATGDWDVTLTVRVRFQTAGNALPSSCNTTFFDIQVIEQNPQPGFVRFDLDPSEPFVIPAVTAAACGGAANASAINSALGLGGGTPAFEFYKVQQSPTLVGS
ncbi:hypothetical protein [Nannocystis punicea]|uniref:Uncharacterized protein n=1 Tax=Nannocystis punicea TaxID=2995304 RepID=A0ABY7GXJ2_9BACT|nr:hypothetical protein [Nannocystis poenicansa]WAS91615.1 hypothetical protein O0S08_35995 [Nannocystis poenicansa]